MTVGMIRSSYLKCLAGDGATRRAARARNVAIATNRDGYGFACTAGGRILESVGTSVGSNLGRDSVVRSVPKSRLVLQPSFTTL